MMAIRDNQIAAQSIGINVMSSRLLAFCISAFLTAIAGSIWAHFIMAFSPRSFYFAETFNIITMLVIGGLGSVSGSVVGAISITTLSEILRNAERGVNLGVIHIPPIYGASQIILAIIFILVIIYYPKGLFGSRELGFNKLWARILPDFPNNSFEKEVQ
jgi:branched-chain amino acid transport system permease protein